MKTATRTAIAFAATAVVSATLAYPLASNAKYRNYQWGDNMSDDSSFTRYEVTHIGVYYRDRYAISNGSNVGAQACNRNVYTSTESCGAWGMAPASSGDTYSSFMVDRSAVGLFGFPFVRFLRIDKTASSAAAELVAWYADSW
ncbi:MAG: hypothetical protein HYV09_22190 [Deltaproteobacteria bacterium]|nr:hypothetical protein [Deltaproteobacteria bacterium]